MAFISIAVIVYQIIIFLIITGSRAGGRGAVIVITILACAWTMTHVFFPPLMFVQFGTIAVAFIVAMAK